MRENTRSIAPHSPPRPEASLGELFSNLTREMTSLLRQELALATTEVGRNVGEAGRSIGILAMGGLVAYAGLLAIVAAVIILLAHVITWWLAAFLVGIVVAGIGYMLVRRALQALQQLDFTPHQTVATLKEDLEWAKDQTT